METARRLIAEAEGALARARLANSGMSLLPCYELTRYALCRFVDRIARAVSAAGLTCREEDIQRVDVVRTYPFARIGGRLYEVVLKYDGIMCSVYVADPRIHIPVICADRFGNIFSKDVLHNAVISFGTRNLRVLLLRGYRYYRGLMGVADEVAERVVAVLAGGDI